jgi:[acyl-carrier-protein] S-malonyltransferase
MGCELCERYEEARLTFEQAERILGMDLRQIAFRGPEETLKQTEHAQPAIFVLSVALSRILASRGGGPDLVAGHSLGEYSSLVASDAIAFEDALRLVKDRAAFMQEACEATAGTMCAIIGLEAASLEEICSGIADGIVDVANINSPGQVVISGEQEAVRTAGEEAKRRGAKRTIPLQGSGAFHSRLMRPAAEKFEVSALSAGISRPLRGFFPNVSASLTDDAEQIRKALVEQICSPVRWQQTIERMIEQGVNTFIEVGPGNVLTGLLKRINRSAVGLNADTPDSIEAIARAL